MSPDIRLVLCTSWRHSVGVQQTIDCLHRNGVVSNSWHSTPACPWVAPSDDAAALGATSASSKSADIRAWLSENQDQIRAWVCIDDSRELVAELSSLAAGRVVLVDGQIGFDLADLATAAGALGLN